MIPNWTMQASPWRCARPHLKSVPWARCAPLRAGIDAVPGNCEGAVVLLGDMPAVTASLVEKVVQAFDPPEDRVICVATAQGERGHPVLWARQFFPELEALDGAAGARAVMGRYPNLVCEVEAGDSAPLADLDTPDALEAITR